MLNSQKPYLINAIYQWCEDNGLTPHLLAKVDNNTFVPKEYVIDQQIVLNISSFAVKDLLINNEGVTFTARFNGLIHDILIPIKNIVAIFAKETNQGLQFEYEIGEEKSPTKLEKKTSNLKLVK